LKTEKRKEYDKSYRLAHKTEAAAYQKKYALKNKEKIEAYQKEYRKTHKGEFKDYAHSYYLANKDKALSKQKEYRKIPYNAYRSHKAQAKGRGIPFDITFEDWFTLWEPHWEGRGANSADGLVMCRTGDKGGYTLDNVRIDTLSNNSIEAWVVRKEDNQEITTGETNE